MTTPVVDFLRAYAQSGVARLHMPGHKGQGLFGIAPYDITEIAGADSLYEADGILFESENNAAKLFGTRHTFYSAEGSSQCIRAMLHIACVHRGAGAAHCVLAGRNAHKAFSYAAAAIGFDVHWLRGDGDASLCRCAVTARDVSRALSEEKEKPAAVFLTSPDYLGNLADLRGVAEVCHAAGVPLLVDNAHGAYLRFLPESLHPMDLGADMCCDSAHKTLPALTGAAYLHIAKGAPEDWEDQARAALALYGSTSPSYLILGSLDRVNAVLADGYAHRLAACIAEVEALKRALTASGYDVCATEPLKLTLRAGLGQTGASLAQMLRAGGCECEYADDTHVVMMFAPDSRPSDYAAVRAALGQNKAPIRVCVPTPSLPLPQAVLSVRAAMYAPSEEVEVDAALGRICAAPTVACPPAIPIAVAGERIDAQAVAQMKRYRVRRVRVVVE